MNQDTKRKLDLFYYSYLMVNNNDKEILKYKFFEEANDYYEVVLAYLLLNYQYNIRYNYGYINVPAGTLLYRIRNYKEDVDYSNISEWQAPPIKFRGQGRMNKMSEEALYLASSEELCLKETNIKKGQKYVIGLYVVTEDIKVGGFNGTNLNPKLTDIHRKIGMILNAFLIAPKRNSKNKDIFDFLESYYKDLILNDPDDIDEFDAIKLPLKFALIPYYNDCYYDITNSICEILQQQYPKLQILQGLQILKKSQVLRPI